MLCQQGCKGGRVLFQKTAAPGIDKDITALFVLDEKNIYGQEFFSDAAFSVQIGEIEFLSAADISFYIDYFIHFIILRNDYFFIRRYLTDHLHVLFYYN